MILNKIWLLFSRTVRRQLIWGAVIVHAVLMTLFIWDVTERQQDLLLEQQISHAKALAQSVSISSGGWLASRDVIGLQEIIDAQARYPELIFAMAVDLQGLILAHTERSRRLRRNLGAGHAPGCCHGQGDSVVHAGSLVRIQR